MGTKVENPLNVGKLLKPITIYNTAQICRQKKLLIVFDISGQIYDMGIA